MSRSRTTFRLPALAALFALFVGAPSPAAQAQPLPACAPASAEVVLPTGVPVVDWSENLAVDAAGNLWVSRLWRQEVQRYDRSGTLTARVPVEAPGALRVGPDGLLYVLFGNAPMSGDQGGVLRLDPAAEVLSPEVFATGLTMPNGAAFGPDGLLYVAATGTGVLRLLPDGSADPAWSAGGSGANGLAVEGGTAYLTANGDVSGRVARFPLADPAARTVLADVSAAGLPDFADDVVVHDGQLYVATLTGQLVRVDPVTGATCAVLGTEPLTALTSDPARPGTLLASTESGAILRVTLGA